MKNYESLNTFKDYSFFKLEEIVYEKDYPKRENFENVISSFRNTNFSFIYILSGKKDKIEIFLGVSKINKDKITTSDYCSDILESNFLGNFQGSKIRRLNSGDIEEKITNKLKKNRYLSFVSGIPTLGPEKKEESSQGIERLINTMIYTEFNIVMICEPCFKEEIDFIEENLFKIYESIQKNSKKTVQEGENSSTGVTKGKSNIKNISTTKSKDDSNSESKGMTDGENSSETKTDGKSLNISYEQIIKKEQNILKLIDETLFKRIFLGRNRGFFKATTYLASINKVYQERLENSVLSLFQSDEWNINPLKINEIELSDKEFNETLLTFKNIYENRPKSPKDIEVDILNSRVLYNNYNSKRSMYLTSKEISLMAGIPQKEVLGLKNNEGVDFGLNISEIMPDDRIELGQIMDRGNILKKTAYLDKKEIKKHIFIGGVTGSGKTTTCHKILLETELPFLVIEPAKTEYRALLNSNKKLKEEMKVYTLGNESILPFRINPFEFLPTENITSHIDMLKACFEASFDMEAAIPQILEAAIYRCYEEYGWDIDDNTNIYLPNNREKAWNSGGIYFPTLEDLIKNTDKVVSEQGFDERLKKDYIGSIKARLQSLIVGSKGQMLNTRCSINFETLLEEKVVLELEEIKNGSDKALIIGIILMRICETLKAKYQKDKNFSHITLLEEAHRLLTKVSQGDSSNKKQAIEVFTDMLAEVRKYGESLIIVDQIPNKLASEVLKNTNTKIIHKIFAKDDKEVVGDTMTMDEKQKKFLSNLEVGETIVFSYGWKKPVCIKMSKITNMNDKFITGEELRTALFEKNQDENIQAFYPEANYVDKGIDLKNYNKNYKQFYSLLKAACQKESFFKELQEQYKEYPEKIKRYLITKLIVEKKAFKILENPLKNLDEEFEFFNKRIIENEFEGKNTEIRDRIKKLYF